MENNQLFPMLGVGNPNHRANISHCCWKRLKSVQSVNVEVNWWLVKPCV